MAQTIFFSWQADRQTKGGRNLVEDALERAVGLLHADASIEEAEREDLAVDRDTKGVAGTPPIVDTIFRKIDNAAIFVADLTFVGTRIDGRPTPNPNVLIEYGWAQRALGNGRMIAVMNSAHGAPTPESMPFDMKHLRFPIAYECADDATQEVRKAEKDRLAKILADAIKAILGSDDFQDSLPKPTVPAEFVRLEPKQGRSRFRATNEPIGISDGNISHFLRAAPKEVRLTPGPAFWLRVMPEYKQNKQWTVPEIKASASHGGTLLIPMGSGYANFDYVRSGDGWGTFVSPFHGEQETRATVFCFQSGEVWTIDTYPAQALDEQNEIMIPESFFSRSLQPCIEFMQRLGVTGPLRWEAGLEGVMGKSIALANLRKIGPILNDTVVCEGNVIEGASAAVTLKPFFDAIYGECGITRQ